MSRMQTGYYENPFIYNHEESKTFHLVAIVGITVHVLSYEDKLIVQF